MNRIMVIAAAIVVACLLPLLAITEVGAQAPAKDKAAPPKSASRPPVPPQPCAEDAAWDVKLELCRPKCAAPLLYDSRTRKCTCGAEDRRYDAASKQCLARCNPPGRFEYKSQTCMCPVVSESYDYTARTCVDKNASKAAEKSTTAGPAAGAAKK